MPREIVVVSARAPDLTTLLEAGAAVDPGLGLRTMREGAVHQLCLVGPDGSGDVAVLSVSQPLAVENAAELARLLPGVAGLDHLAAPLWWVEALAPWGDAGRVGVRVAQELALRLGGVCVVQDGE
ncbi:hypothetical protein N866_09835 [Actinotalea ferrariae CF5-4]|uniref:Uncharacterized protein n=1 Tax=Actinotalea ferrariae CF5-4 TaxID=948458 RepID=A0A021VMA9_9CELL|nr:hypothetical protein [Actinotalea ferrariae]EYR62296.1 hypothetical protein N866_09835 [Actinotalea ferrariae CF5-4]